MKNLAITPHNGYHFLEVNAPISGTHAVTLSTDPFHIEEGRIVEAVFENGKAVLKDLALPTRTFFYLNAGDEQYIGAERRLPISGLYNCRDLGGYVNRDGKWTKWGMFYRSDAPDHLQQADIDYLEKMAFSTVIDFRAPKEIAVHPDIYFGEQYHLNFNPHAEVARTASETPSKTNKDRAKVEKLEQLAKTVEGQQKLVAMQQQMVTQMNQLVLSENALQAYQQFAEVLVNDQVPLMFHCQGGKDRTGWAAAIILGLLDVPKETIYADYLQTERFNKPRNDMRMAIYKQFTDNSFVLDFLASLQQTKTDYLDGAFHAMEKHYGTMENYAITALGVSQEQIQQFRAAYLYQ